MLNLELNWKQAQKYCAKMWIEITLKLKLKVKTCSCTGFGHGDEHAGIAVLLLAGQVTGEFNYFHNCYFLVCKTIKF